MLSSHGTWSQKSVRKSKGGGRNKDSKNELQTYIKNFLIIPQKIKQFKKIIFKLCTLLPLQYLRVFANIVWQKIYNFRHYA
jgi:hypothetical protein